MIEQAGGGRDMVVSSITLTLAAGAENLTLSGSGGISGTGNGLAHGLAGNAGDNILRGLDGADQLSGADGKTRWTAVPAATP